MPTIKSQRESLGLTQIQVAMGAEVSLQLVRKLEQVGLTSSPECKRVIEYIEELDRKRERESHPAYELRVAMERAIAELGDLPNDPQVMALKAKLESIFPDVCVMVGIEEPGTLEGE